MTIKEIAGGVLLYLYLENIRSPLDIDLKFYYFRYQDSQWAEAKAADEFQDNLLQAAQGNENDLLNALRYLISAGLINENTNGSDSGGLMYRDMTLKAPGFDIVEGIERKEESTQRQFNFTFNFHLESIAKIAPILKTKFGLLNVN